MCTSIEPLFRRDEAHKTDYRVFARNLNRPVYAIVSSPATSRRRTALRQTQQDTRNHGDSPHDPRHDYNALASDVAGFITEHNLKDTTLIGHSMYTRPVPSSNPKYRQHFSTPPLLLTQHHRGAKTAMAVALHDPSLVANLISVDNAPVDAALGSDFGKYMQGMRKVEEAKAQKQTEADEILMAYEEVRTLQLVHHWA